MTIRRGIALAAVTAIGLGAGAAALPAAADTAPGAADLAITKTASPRPAYTNEALTYTLRVTDVGTTPATGVGVSDPLPAGTTFISATPSQGTCVQAGGTVTCALGALDSGGTATVALAVITPADKTSLVNTATVSGDQPDPNPADNTAALQVSLRGRNCGLVITESMTFTADIGPCLGAGIVIDADNITVDLGGHHIFGSTRHEDKPGIDIENHTGVTVKNGDVSHFDTGVLIYRGVANTVTGLSVHDNIGRPSFDSFLGDGIAILHSSSNQVLANTVTRNGVHAGIRVAGLDSDNNLIETNTVRDTVGAAPATAGASALGGQGIVVTAVLEPTDPRRGLPIRLNNVGHNSVFDNAGSGISLVSDTDALIDYNDVEGNGVGTAAAGRNGIEVGFDAEGGAGGATFDTIRHNKVMANGDDGIVVMSGANVIIGNRALDDNVNADGSVDLHDVHPDCDSNRWKANTWGSGGFSPPCVTIGGTGPAAPSPA